MAASSTPAPEKAASAFQTADAPRAEDYSKCIRCGLCLNACPTFRVLGEELDSPRGRIYQVRQADEGRITMDAEFRLHMDRCLDCRACVTACPSGVPYGAIIERARAELRSQRPPSLAQRFLLNQFIPYPGRLRAAASLIRFYQTSGLQSLVRASGVLNLLGLEKTEKLCPALDPGQLPFDHEFGRTFPPDRGQRRARVLMLPGCAQNVLLPGLNQATLRVLRRQGCEVTIPGDIGCCGALHQHAGMREDARRLARHNIAAMERALDSGVEAIVINAAGCGAALKEYPDLFDRDPEWHRRAERVSARMRDVTEFLDEIGLRRELLGPVPLKATYQDPCHLAHAQRIRSAPRNLMAAIPGLELREMQRSDQCCGSAGIYNLQQPEIAAQLLADRKDVIAATGGEVTLIVTANPGCMMQLAGAASPSQRVLHVVELLDEAHRNQLPVASEQFSVASEQ